MDYFRGVRSLVKDIEYTFINVLGPQEDSTEEFGVIVFTKIHDEYKNRRLIFYFPYLRREE